MITADTIRLNQINALELVDLVQLALQSLDLILPAKVSVLHKPSESFLLRDSVRYDLGLPMLAVVKVLENLRVRLSLVEMGGLLHYFL